VVWGYLSSRLCLGLEEIIADEMIDKIAVAAGQIVLRDRGKMGGGPAFGVSV
jgi:hypothetical protein